MKKTSPSTPSPTIPPAQMRVYTDAIQTLRETQAFCWQVYSTPQDFSQPQQGEFDRIKQTLIDNLQKLPEPEAVRQYLEFFLAIKRQLTETKLPASDNIQPAYWALQVLLYETLCWLHQHLKTIPDTMRGHLTSLMPDLTTSLVEASVQNLQYDPTPEEALYYTELSQESIRIAVTVFENAIALNLPCQSVYLKQKSIFCDYLLNRLAALLNQKAYPAAEQTRESLARLLSLYSNRGYFGDHANAEWLSVAMARCETYQQQIAAKLAQAEKRKQQKHSAKKKSKANKKAAGAAASPAGDLAEDLATLTVAIAPSEPQRIETDDLPPSATSAAKDAIADGQPNDWLAEYSASIQKNFQHITDTGWLPVFITIAQLLQNLPDCEAYGYGSWSYKDNIKDIDLLLSGQGNTLLTALINQGARILKSFNLKLISTDGPFSCEGKTLNLYGKTLDLIFADLTPEQHHRYLDYSIGACYFDFRRLQRSLPYLNTQEDIAQKTLRMIEDPAPRFRLDPSVALRAIRLMPSGFRFEKTTAKALHECLHTPENFFQTRLATPSTTGWAKAQYAGLNPDKLYTEMVKLFFSGNAANNLHFLIKLGLIKKLFTHAFSKPQEKLFYFLLWNVAYESDRNFSAGTPMPPSVLYYAAYWQAHFRACNLVHVTIEPSHSFLSQNDPRSTYRDAQPVINLQRTDHRNILTANDQPPRLDTHTAYRNWIYLNFLEYQYHNRVNPHVVCRYSHHIMPPVPLLVPPLASNSLPLLSYHPSLPVAQQVHHQPITPQAKASSTLSKPV